MAMKRITVQNEAPLMDPYGRRVNSLRISITQRCNFECFFCHQEGESNPSTELSPKEIEAIVSVGAQLGITKVKLTGGEPLLRNDLIEILERISPHVEEVSMTTNGYLLAEKACKLKEVGLDRINVSYHTGDPGIFCRIIGKEAFPEVKAGILAANRCNLTPVKLNMMVMSGVNDVEIEAMIGFAKETGSILQLIEFQPLEKGEKSWAKYYYDLKPLEAELEARSAKVIVREMHRRKRYHLQTGGIIEVVRPMHNTEFCKYCTRLRVTSDGYLKPCLMREDNHVEAATLLRKGGRSKDILAAFREAVSKREPYWR
jgi:cyclic pyranopterin phosphate synthase